MGAEVSYPEATGSRPAPRLFALKHGDTFIVADAHGDIYGDADGLFHHDTRILSRFQLVVGGRSPSLLGGGIGHDNVLFATNLTNRPLPPIGGKSTPEGVIHIERTRLLWEARLYERLRLRNYGRDKVAMLLSLRFAADFRDMFEIRGLERRMRGHTLPPAVEGDAVTLRYRGLDDLERTAVLRFAPRPTRLTRDSAEVELELMPGSRTDLFIEVGIEPAPAPSRQRYRAASARARYAMRTVRRHAASVRSTDRLFDDWLTKSRADLALLTTQLDTGPYPYAGIPWFSTCFGRDAVITALQVLWLDPALAQGVLRFLAATQSSETSAFRDSAPGKIMHETRKGEMARLDEIPFARYYGGVDTTPLFVMLAGAYAMRTGDLGLIDGLWPALLAAIGWIEVASGAEGFLTYARGAETGLANQGWKDSHDSVFHADGSDAPGPIALVEVQGYAYAAFRAMADLAVRRGLLDDAARWSARAEQLRQSVEHRFWLDDLGTYALALDGLGNPCRVRSSNPGHLLYAGLPTTERARRVAIHFMGAEFNSGWGIRTIAAGEARYNPMSYHNGSVWPHDTAMCVAGMARYGERGGVERLLGEAYAAAVSFDMSLPELFCGFERRAGEPPIAYPVACLPQAWASGSVAMMLQACLGLTIDGWRCEVHVERPRLPAGIERLTIRRLAVGEASVDLTFHRFDGRVAVYPEGQDPSAVPVISHA
jgi:glycogen debranching enzyme